MIRNNSKRSNPLFADRMASGLSQDEYSALIGCSTRTLVTMESLPTDSPRLTKYLNRIRRSSEQGFNQGGFSYSWDSEIYSELLRKNQMQYRVNRVRVIVDLKQSTRHKDYVTHGMSIWFDGLYTGDGGEGLLIDAVGNPDVPEGEIATLSVTLGHPWKRLTSDTAPQQDYIAMDGLEFVRLPIEYTHVVGYQLKSDPKLVPSIELIYDSEFAARIGPGKKDAMGFAIPPDLLVGEVEIKVIFHNDLCPIDPSTRPFPIRRYARAARPKLFTTTDVAPPELQENPSENTRAYTFNILSPKNGYGYVVSWTGIKKQPFDSSLKPKRRKS